MNMHSLDKSGSHDIGDTGIACAAVIGAGAMGSGLAAQFANAGIPVFLLDIPGQEDNRNAPAEGGVVRQLKANGFMHENAARLVTTGNVDDHLDRLAEADWIIEAVVENLDVKHALYRKIDRVRKAGSIVSSNTSTIPRVALISGSTDEFAADFIITHFFNPPRFMQLVEIVGAADNDQALLTRVSNACETILGKTIVNCFDTPGFIANRIGCLWLSVAVIDAVECGLTVEEADASMVALGVPSTGAFGLLDLIGIDLVPLIWGSLIDKLPPTDALNKHALITHPLITELIAQGHFGRKTKAGFYRQGPNKIRDVLDLSTGKYRAENAVSKNMLPGEGGDISALLNDTSPLGRYAWWVLSSVIAYSAEHASEIAEDIGAIDTAMILGYAWKEGPFQLVQRYGIENFIERMQHDGHKIPDLILSARNLGGFFSRTGQPLMTDGSGFVTQAIPPSLLAPPSRRVVNDPDASIIDIGDGVSCLEIHTKLNSISPGVLNVIEQALERGGSDFDALVIGNDKPRTFSAGANLSHILSLLRNGSEKDIEEFLLRGQQLLSGLKYAPFPVVAAAHGLALGGGCEILLHADLIVAHAELNAGLPETKVGLIPSWGGCTQLLVRGNQSTTEPKGPAAIAAAVFTQIQNGHVHTSAQQASSAGILRKQDKIVMNRAHVLTTAKALSLQLIGDEYQPPAQTELSLSGPSGKLGLIAVANGQKAAGVATPTDMVIADQLATIVSGGLKGDPLLPISENALMQLEREAFLLLANNAATHARIEHMLATGKPLRN